MRRNPWAPVCQIRHDKMACFGCDIPPHPGRETLVPPCTRETARSLPFGYPYSANRIRSPPGKACRAGKSDEIMRSMAPREVILP